MDSLILKVENIQRRDLSPIEEAKSYKKLLDRGYLTQDQLAGRMGKTQATISNKLRLLNLDEEVQDALLNNKISERHARSLLRLEDKYMQRKVLEEILEKRLNVRDTESLISNKLNPEIEKTEFIQISNVEQSEDTNNNMFDFPELLVNKPVEENKLEDIDAVLNNITTSINIPSLEEEIEIIEDEEVLESEEDIISLEDIYNKNNNKDINLVIDKINNLISEINKLGFDVKLDKYDFDELYQFVIKIEKE